MDKGKPPESNKPYLIDWRQYSKFHLSPSSSKAHKNFLLFSDRLRNPQKQKGAPSLRQMHPCGSYLPASRMASTAFCTCRRFSASSKGFLAATIGSCVGSAFIGAFGVRLYGYITSSIFSIPAYIGPYFIYAAIGWVIAFGLSFVLSYLFVVKMDRS